MKVTAVGQEGPHPEGGARRGANDYVSVEAHSNQPAVPDLVRGNIVLATKFVPAQNTESIMFVIHDGGKYICGKFLSDTAVLRASCCALARAAGNHPTRLARCGQSTERRHGRKQ